MADTQSEKGPDTTEDVVLSDAALDEVSGGLLPLTCPRCGKDVYSGHTC